MNALMRSALARAGVPAMVAWTFDAMEIAERAMRRLPPWAFKVLCPSPVLSGLSLTLYEAHVTELVGRIRRREDTRPGTRAEVLAGLLAAATIAPLDATGCALAESIFVDVFKGKGPSVLEAERPREMYPGAMEERLADARRKMTVADRRRAA